MKAKYRTYPDCPKCDSDIYVEGNPSNTAEYVCHLCELDFDRRVIA